MLTGQAKVDYQREYMRRRRAGLGKPPKGEREPTRAEIRDIEYLARSRHTRRWDLKQQVLKLKTDEDVVDFVRRQRQEKRDRRANARARAEAKALNEMLDRAEYEAEVQEWEFSRWPRKVFTCIFCDAASGKAKMSGNGLHAICLDCAREAVRILESNAPPEV